MLELRIDVARLNLQKELSTPISTLEAKILCSDFNKIFRLASSLAEWELHIPRILNVADVKSTVVVPYRFLIASDVA